MGRDAINICINIFVYIGKALFFLDSFRPCFKCNNGVRTKMYSLLKVDEFEMNS